MNKFQPSGDFVNDCYDQANGAENVARSLCHLALSFQETGNNAMFNRLWGYGDMLLEMSENIRKICSGKVDSDFKEATAMTGAILTAHLMKADKKD
jgi:hypothetical protein